MKIFDKFKIDQKLRQILILVKISEKLILNFFFRKISILVEIVAETQFLFKSFESLDYSKCSNNLIISRFVKIFERFLLQSWYSKNLDLYQF